LNTEFDPNSLPPENDEDSGYKISLARKIIMGIFILGFWIFFYWYRSSPDPIPPAPAPTPVEKKLAD
jgi:hypothetical protein